MFVDRRRFLSGVAGLTAFAYGGRSLQRANAAGAGIPASSSKLVRRSFWFLRHGETDWNAQNLTQGNIDIPLNEAGRAQAVQAANRLRDKGIRTIVSSPLSRAHDTALAVAKTVGREVLVDEELHEVSFGVRERQSLGSWYDDWISGAVTPQGAESFVELRARTVRALNRAVALHSPVLVVAHGGLFRAVRAEMGLEPNVRTPNATPFFCEPGPTDAAPWSMTPA